MAKSKYAGRHILEQTVMLSPYGSFTLVDNYLTTAMKKNGYVPVCEVEVPFTVPDDWREVPDRIEAIDAQIEEERAASNNKIRKWMEEKSKLLALDHSKPTDVDVKYDFIRPLNLGDM